MAVQRTERYRFTHGRRYGYSLFETAARTVAAWNATNRRQFRRIATPEAAANRLIKAEGERDEEQADSDIDSVVVDSDASAVTSTDPNANG